MHFLFWFLSHLLSPAMAAATHYSLLELRERQLLGDWTNGSFAALGGSNTLGACDIKPVAGCNQTSFAKLTYDALSHLGLLHHFANGGIGAMGPQLASACTHKFVPDGTRFATIEYLPNLGYTNDSVGLKCLCTVTFTAATL